MTRRTEKDITKNWKYSAPPLVSIVCIAYNHEAYIRDAIEGFLMQETDFPFEIIIHDDASKDGTAAIIEEYRKNYPNLIRAILQTINQYSQQVGLPSQIAFSKCRGEYVAICEGDDYWTDPKKISIQYAEMQKHMECHLSFHPAVKKDVLNNLENTICEYKKESFIFKTEQVILGGGGFCPTASLMVKKEVLLSVPEKLYKDAPVGDFFWQIFGSLNGGALYLNPTMSVYRVNIPNSWSSRPDSFDSRLDLIKKIHLSLDELDASTSFAFSTSINRHKAENFSALSSYACRFKLDEQFKWLIVTSWELYSFCSIRQTLLYYLRFSPFILRLGYHVIRFFKDFFPYKTIG